MREVPSDKAELELKESPTVAFHKTFALVKALLPSVVGIVLLYVEYQRICIGHIDTGNDEKQ